MDIGVNEASSDINELKLFLKQQDKDFDRAEEIFGHKVFTSDKRLNVLKFCGWTSHSSLFNQGNRK